ncbi:hypothetical protein TorRG33x02_179970 [Trema orientale]|uniref:Uncharacterized protein n=1 Tax=Trema orientale TaxID=63057 RepID=A0A2P5EL45_TREOI|nr:hypothetical protein TorRG33x02_179970 [Trema orientale]
MTNGTWEMYERPSMSWPPLRVRICKPCFLEHLTVAWTWEASSGVTITSGFGVEGEENRGFCMVEFKTEIYEVSFGV